MKMKNLIAALLWVMLSLGAIAAAPPGGVTVYGYVSPIDRGDPYSVTREEWGNHSFRVVPSAAYRTSTSGDGDVGISMDRRRVGMIVLQLDNNHAYQLQANLTTWNDLGLFNLTAGSNIYNTDGTLLANRVVTGNNLGLSFNGVSLFQVNAANIAISSTASTTIASLASAVTTAGTVADINAPNVRINPAGNKYVFNSISTPAVSTDEVLAYNPATGEVRRSNLKTLAGVGATQVNIYNTDGTLTADRTVNGAGHDLTLTGIKVLTLSSQDSVVSTSLDTHFQANQMRISGASKLTINTEIPGISGQYLRNDGGNDQVHYATIYHEGRGVKSGSIYTFSNATTNTYLFPEYTLIDEIPAGSFAVLQFDLDSTGGEFIKLGPLTTSIPIATHDGSIVTAGTIRSNVPYMLIKGGSGGTAKWYIQGNTAPIGGGGGGGNLNIYNSNGSLTGTRILDGNGYTLSMQNAANIYLNATATVKINGSSGVSIETPASPSIKAGQYLRLQPQQGYFVQYDTIYYKGFSVKSGANYTADGINLYPAYTAGVQHPDGTIVLTKFSAESTAGDTLVVGNSPATKIVHQDGSDVLLGELKMERYYTMILSGTGGTARWVLQGNTSLVQDSSTPDNSVKIFDTVADMVAHNPSAGNEAFTRGYWAPGDNGGGRYYFLAGGTDSINEGTVHNAIGGRWILVNPGIVTFNQFGVKQDDDELSGPDNVVRFQNALNAFISGGHLLLPASPNRTYIGPDQIFLNSPVQGLVIELNGNIKRPPSLVGPTGDNRQSFIQVEAAPSANHKIHIKGSGIIDGDAINQDFSPAHGQENCIKILNAANVIVEGLTIRNFGYFALYVGKSKNVKVDKLTISQIGGNNDADSWGANMDGIHFYAVTDGIISNCNIESTDDCIAVSGIEGDISRRVTINNCILNPYACHPNFLNHGIRIGPDQGGYTNVETSDIKVSNVIINCHASHGVVVGCAAASTRSFVKNVSFNNVQINDAFVGNIQIGPNAGNAPTATVGSAAIGVLNVESADFDNIKIVNAKNAGIVIANAGKVKIHNSSITNVETGADPAWPSGTGIALSLDSVYGGTDELIVSNTEIDDVDGGGILGYGSLNSLDTLRVSNSRVTKWNQSLRTARSYGAFGSFNSKLIMLDNVVANDGQACAMVFYPKRVGDEFYVANSSFGDLGNSAATPGAFLEMFSDTTALWGTFESVNCKYGAWRPANQMLRAKNPLRFRFLNNVVFVPTFGSSVDSYAISAFMGATSGSSDITLKGNAWSIPTANGPSTILGILNGGSLLSTPVLHIKGDNTVSTEFIPFLATGFTTTKDIDWNTTKQRSTAVSITAGYQDSVVIVTAAANVTLPSAVYVPGKVYTVKKRTGGAVTVISSASQTFDGVASPYTITSSATFQSDGANWVVLSDF